MIKKFWHKVSVFWKMILVFRNWPTAVLYRLGLLPQTTILETRDGAKFRIRDRREELSDAYVINESYLYNIHAGILPYLKNAKVGIDIGAHIGAFTVFAAMRSPARIFSFEPAPHNRKILEENIHLNNLKSRVKVLPVVVAGKKGEVELYIPENGGLVTTSRKHLEIYQADVDTEVIKVPAITLGDFFVAEKIDFCDFIKMDCEGDEYDILYNLSGDIFKRIGVMTIECHADRSIGELMEFLRRKNFEVKRPSVEFAEIFCRNKNYNYK